VINKYIFVLLTGLFCCNAFSQKVFIADHQGYVSDTAFHSLIKERRYELVGSFNELGLAKIRKSKLWGVIDISGNEILETAYDEVVFLKFSDEFSDISSLYGLLKVRKSKLWGLRDFTGKEMLKTEYDLIDIVNGGRYFIVKKEGKSILCASDGKMIRNFIFDEVSVTDDPGFFKVRNAERCGLADSTGRIIIPLEYKEIFNLKPGVYAVRKKKYFGVVNSRNKILISFRYKAISNYHEGYAVVDEFLDQGIVFGKHGKIKKYGFDDIEFLPGSRAAIMKCNDKYGLLDLKKGVLLPMAYYEITHEKYKGKNVFIVQKDSNGHKVSGIIDEGGKWLFPITSKWFHYRDPDRDPDLITVFDQSGKQGAINGLGEIILPCICQNISFTDILSDSVWVLTCDYNRRKRAIYAANVQIPVTPDLQEVEMMDNYFCYVRKNNKVALMSTSGNFITPFIYDAINLQDDDGIYLFNASQDGKWGFLDRNGKVVVPLVYDEIYLERHGKLLAKSGEKYALLEPSGTEITPFIYQEVWVESSGFRVLKDKKWGMLDVSGKEVLVPLYDEVRCINETFLIATREGKISVFRNFEIFTDTLSDQWQILSGGFYPDFDSHPVGIFEIGKKYGLVDSFWHIIVPAKFDMIDRCGKSFIAWDNLKFDILDSMGFNLDSSHFKDVRCLYNNVLAEGPETSKLIDRNGQLVTEFRNSGKITDAWLDNYNVLWLEVNDSWAMVNLGNKIRTVYRYNNPGKYIEDKKVYEVKVQRHFINFLDLNGKEMIPEPGIRKSYERVGPFFQVSAYDFPQYSMGYSSGRGLMDWKGTLLLPMRFSKFSLNGTTLTAYVNNRYEIYNSVMMQKIGELDRFNDFRSDGFADGYTHGYRTKTQYFLLDKYGSLVEE
jgi:hypothetical protein